jgi:hypothetical protein
MAKVTLDDITNLDSSTAVQTINDNSESIVDALDNTLSRDGSTPNQMEANLDMNSNRILNLPAPVSTSEPLRLADVGGVLPSAIAGAGASAAAAAASASAAAASATAAAGYVGAATQAPKWTTGRTIILSGDVTGTSPAWDGTTNLAFSGTVISASSITAAKMAVGAAAGNLGYTPVNKTGDVVTGDIQLSYAATSLLANSIGFRGIPVNEQDVNYTFVVDDCGRLVRHNSGSAHAYTINPVASTNYPVGTTICVRNVGSGVVTLTRGAGVTLRKVGSATDANIAVAQWGLATLVQEASDVWMVTGTGIT